MKNGTMVPFILPKKRNKKGTKKEYSWRTVVRQMNMRHVAFYRLWGALGPSEARSPQTRVSSRHVAERSGATWRVRNPRLFRV